MKPSYIVLSLAFIAVLFFSCQKEVDYVNRAPEEANSILREENAKLKKAVTYALRQVYLAGQVLDEAGVPVTGALVKAGSKEVYTDNNGFYNFRASITVNRDYALVTVKKKGYMHGFKTFTPSKKEKISHNVDIVLQQRPAANIINSGTGGSVTIDGKIGLVFPENSIVTKQGHAYTGEVRIEGRYIDPQAENFSQIMPGMLSGLNSAGQLRAMISFGMASIDLYDASGNELEVAPGKLVKMEMPASPGSPATIPLWHFNETYGIWIQAGHATKDDGKYTAEVNHFSIWNLDLEENSFELNLQFVAGDSSFPLSSRKVEISNASTGDLLGTFQTDARGEATLINCPSNIELKLTIPFKCRSFEKILAPLTASRLEKVKVSAPPAEVTVFSLNGILYNCNNDILKNHPFEIRLNNGSLTSYQLTSDEQGKYDASIVLCKNTNEISIRAYSYINNEFRFSPSETITPGDNIYSPVICYELSQGSQYDDEDEVIFPDAKLENTVRGKIAKPSGAILHKDVKNITFLDISLKGIKNLQGLEHFISLDSLYAYSNAIEDIGPVRQLTRLKCILVSNNKLDDSAVDIIKGLPDMQYVSIGANVNITSILPLAGLTELTGLNLQSTKVTDISVIRNFPHLVDLSLSKNNLGNIAEVAGLIKLERLWMDSTNVQDISVIANLTNLKVFHASGNNISDISPLENCREIQHLNLHTNSITDISPLKNMNALRGVFISKNQLTTISPVLKNYPLLADFDIINGNSIPTAEINTFKSLNPDCTVK